MLAWAELTTLTQKQLKPFQIKIKLFKGTSQHNYKVQDLNHENLLRV